MIEPVPMPSLRRFALACLVGVSAAADQGVAFAQAPGYTAGTRTVAVYATVRNADGRLVPDLLKDDFTVDDNGRQQPLTLFADDVQPITAVVLLDRSSSMRGNFSLVEQAAEAFVDAMGPADKARIGSFSNFIQVDPPDFTSDHDALKHILQTDLQPEGPTPLWNAVNVGITDLLHQQGRRVVLVFTDGADAPGNGSANQSFKDVMKRAEAEDVMVYAVGLAGSHARSDRGQRGGYGGYGGRGGGMGRGGFGGGRRRGGYGGGSSTANRENAGKPDPNLPKLADATGGGYFELTSTDALSSTFARIADELHHQYVLGFTPPKLDGKTHTLSVRVMHENMTVRARKTYVASKEERP